MTKVSARTRKRLLAEKLMILLITLLLSGHTHGHRNIPVLTLWARWELRLNFALWSRGGPDFRFRVDEKVRSGADKLARRQAGANFVIALRLSSQFHFRCLKTAVILNQI